MPEKIKTNKPSFETIVKVILYIIFITIATYVIMAIITHFSLNNTVEKYQFLHSLISVFDTDTAIFNFFKIFIFIESGFIILAILIKQIYDKVF